jgi:uncharacterized damage-inducible protein DinB
VTDDLRFPIGDFRAPPTTTEVERIAYIDQIEAAPARLREAVRGMEREQLETPYRPGGWTVRQVVHHVPDSHLNAYVRFRLALTEDEPTIKPYQEDRWAELPDARSAPPEESLDLLDALHRRWTRLLRSLAASDWDSRYRHPELGLMSLQRVLALYAWHGRHHVAHVTSLRDRMGWH